jgi:hypothetical protein
MKVTLMNAKETSEMVSKSGKLMVLQQILPLWRKQSTLHSSFIYVHYIFYITNKFFISIFLIHYRA